MALSLRTLGAFSLLFVAGSAAAKSSFDLALDYPEAIEAAASEAAGNVELASLSGDCCVEPDCGASDCCDDSSCCADACCGEDACCGDASCGTIARAMICPMWTVRAGAVILNRSRPAGRDIVVPLAGPGAISTGDDFGLGWAAGPDVSLLRRTKSGNTWELRYFGALDWEGDAAYGAVGNVRIGSFSNFGATNFTGRYISSLDSTEVNFYHPRSDRFEWLAGFRWIELRDDLTYTITFPAFTADYNWHETNHLYGGQLGGKFNLWNLSSPLSITSTMKAGVYGNDANNNFTLLPSTGGQFDGGLEDSDVAFVGEIDLTTAYQLTKHVALRGGYQLLWIDGVALASENGAASTAASSQAVINTTGDVFYHGAMMSVDFMW